MNLLKLFKPRKYDMDTVEGINAIPIPARNYNTGNDLQDCIYYVLQRKATEHKKAGRMDCAIACLRKSNELSDYEKRPLLTQKEYLRLVKYIELSGDYNLAQEELNRIYHKHPEFLDKRVSNLIQIKAAIKQNKERKNDFLFIITNSKCPICSQYNRQVYSISGKSHKYPKLPPEISKNGGSCPNCLISVSSFFDGISTPPNYKN
mgnify:CR=1 FL=1